MLIKIALAPADYALFQYRAARCRLPLESYLEEVLSVAACDLRQVPSFTVTMDDAWARRPGLTQGEDDDESIRRPGRSVEQLDAIHREAMTTLKGQTRE